MPLIKPPFGFVGRAVNKPFMTLLSSLSLTTNLKLCLDAGDIASYSSGQTWTDRSGVGSNFVLGLSASVGADDPAFNGSAGGLSSNEYFTVDGTNDLFNIPTAPAWTKTLHKDNAIFTLFMMVYVTGNGTLFSTRTNAVGGILWEVNAGKLMFRCLTSVTTPLTATSDGTVSTGSWHALWITLDETGVSPSSLGIDGAITPVSGSNTFTATYSSPTATDTTLAQIAAGFGGVFLPSGSRVMGLAAWQGTAVSSANLIALYNLVKSRLL